MGGGHTFHIGTFPPDQADEHLRSTHITSHACKSHNFLHTTYHGVEYKYVLRGCTPAIQRPASNAHRSVGSREPGDWVGALHGGTRYRSTEYSTKSKGGWRA